MFDQNVCFLVRIKQKPTVNRDEDGGNEYGATRSNQLDVTMK